MRPAMLLALAAAVLGLAVAGPIPKPTVNWYTQTLDHFNWKTHPRTFQQKYLVVDEWYQPGGPIMFYCGNEGPIEAFYDNTGFIFDHAPVFNALVVFAEHRYYGDSLPFGKHSFHHHNISYLSVSQALADYNLLLHDLRANYSNAPVIAIGGSYGGILAAWMRVKYPQVVDMALAASAPIKEISQQIGSTVFFETVTNTFAQANANCPEMFRRGFSSVLEYAAQGESGLATITDAFQLCDPLEADEVEHLILWAVNAFTVLAMVDYPYPADFMAPLPGWPVTVACNAGIYARNPLEALAAATSLFYNGTHGKLQCFDIFTEFIECADQTGCGTGPSGVAWDYQACTELIWYLSSNNETDMFPPRVWSPTNLTDYCHQRFGIVPRPNWQLEEYGSGNISTSASHIIFSNGLLDPWHTGGFLTNLSDTLVAVVIEDGAHHLDLRGSNPQDPASVIAARAQEVAYFQQWLSELEARKQQ